MKQTQINKDTIIEQDDPALRAGESGKSQRGGRGRAKSG